MSFLFVVLGIDNLGIGVRVLLEQELTLTTLDKLNELVLNNTRTPCSILLVVHAKDAC